MTLSVQKMVKHTLKILQHLLQYFYSVLGHNANTKHLTRSQYVSFGCRFSLFWWRVNWYDTKSLIAEFLQTSS